MNIQTCPKNIRCDSISCNKLTAYSVNTSSYKGGINLCEDCFNRLYKLLQEMKKQITKTTEVKNEKRKNKY